MKKENRNNREFTIIAYFFIALFVSLIIYLCYFQIVESETVINNTYNKRIELFADKVIRGDILSREGEVLATTSLDSEKKETRVYPYKKIFAHAIGFSTNGTTGLEDIANFELLRTHSFIGTQIVNLLTGNKSTGDTVVSTFSASLQKTAYEALANYDGAVIAMDPESGELLCMVSKPDFDPNEIINNYDKIIGEDEDSSALLNRATQGSYTPGSTFKIFTTLEYFRENGIDANFEYTCDGSYSYNDVIIHCVNNKKHGQLDLEDAFAHSCNSAYSKIGLSLDMEGFKAYSKKLLFNSKLPTDYPYKKSNFSLDKNSDTASIMQGSIGQDKITLSPLHLLLITSAICNDGVVMKPYEIIKVVNDQGTSVTEYSKEEYKTILSKEYAAKLKEYMLETVESGTATSLQSKNYTAGGKTGSAEVSDSSDDTHSWFVGFAENEEGKKIAIAVIVERKGNGSKYAVPIAKKVFDQYFDN